MWKAGRRRTETSRHCELARRREIQMSRFSSLARGPNLVAAGILLSRISGLIRTLVLGAVLGGTSTQVTDAVGLAMRAPNLLQNLLGEGSLSASFIPAYAKLVEDGKRREADDLASVVVTALAIVTSAIVLVGVLAARPVVWLFTVGGTGNPETFELAVTLTRITTIGLGFLVISAWCLGILNSHRSFFLSYVAPVIWNVTQIVALLFATAISLDLDTSAVVLAWAMVAGGLFQLLVQLPKVRRLAPTVRPRLRRSDAFHDVLRRFVPAVGARGVVQLSSYVDLALAGLLASGAFTWNLFVQPLYVLPISVFGFSVAATELAEMSRRSDELDVVARRLRPAIQRVVLPAGIITAAYVAGGRVFLEALYGFPARALGRDGLSDPAALTTMAFVLAAFAIGLPATMTARVSQNTLYSLGDVKGPARIALIRFLIGATVGLTMMLQLDWITFDGEELRTLGAVPHWPPFERVPLAERVEDQIPNLGFVGLGIGSSVAAWTEWALLRRRLHHRLGPSGGSIFSSGWTRPVTIASLGAAAVMAVVARLDVPSPIDAVVVGLLGVAVYAGALWIQRVRPTFGRPGG